ncbi:MAG: GGDEF domain-containing protein [Pseudomonadota bacterium]
MFRLLRYFSITSLFGIFAVVVVLSMFYRYLAFDALMEHETRANADLTRVFANSIWPKYENFIKHAANIKPEALTQQPEISALHDEVTRHMRGLNVVKVKIYDLDGLTVFSTHPKQIGEDKSTNTGFLSARRGMATSAITFRDQFDAFEGTLFERNLVSSYIPIRDDDTSSVEAVFEVYSDVTDLVVKLEATQWQIISGVFTSLGLLYAFLFFIVKRADMIILSQEEKRQENEATIRHLAYHDALTGLPNRPMFMDRLKQAISRCSWRDRVIAVGFLDIDRFKIINDTYGHDVGDELLKTVARRLTECLRDGDTVGRLGGDEFVVLLNDIAKVSDIPEIATKIVSVLSEPFELTDYRLDGSCSLGIAVYPSDGQDPHTILKRADEAMYRAKADGRNQYRLYSEGNDTDKLRHP